MKTALSKLKANTRATCCSGFASWCTPMLGLVLLTVFCGASLASAQQVSLSMEVDQNSVTAGSTFTLEVRADVKGADADGLKLPDLGEFEIVGHQLSKPMQFSFSFGTGGAHRNVQSSIVHTFSLRAPGHSGNFTLGPASLRLGRQTYRSNVVAIRVTGSAPSSSSTLTTAPPTSNSDMVNYDDKAFVRAVIDKESLYLGEQATVSIYLYIRGSLRSSPTVTQEASANGFWTQDLIAAGQNIEPSLQLINGYNFRVYLLRQFAAIPLRTGELHIGALEITIPTGSLFDLFGGGGRNVERKSQVLDVNIKDIPDHPRKAELPLVVGSLKLEMGLDRPNTATGDAARLTLTLQGQGDLSAVALELPTHRGLRALEPETRLHVETANGLVQSTKTFEWLIVAEKPGNYKIPPFEVLVFDPEKKSFSVAQSNPLTLTAVGNPIDLPSEAEETKLGSNEDGADDIDIVPKTSSTFLRKEAAIPKRPWFWFLLCLPPGALALVLSWRKGQKFLRRKRLNPSRSSKKELSSLESLAVSETSQPFFGELDRILRQSIEQQIGEGSRALTFVEIEQALQTRGLSLEVIKKLIKLLKAIERQRFSADSEGDDRKDLLQTAKQVLSKMKAKRP
ncbi:MAG: protein BatD [Myxococcales bacterium]|nr:MAG: protein BatD [Myxococcales bacterium]